MPHKLAFIGFGTVGQGLAEVLRGKTDELRWDINRAQQGAESAIQGST